MGTQEIETMGHITLKSHAYHDSGDRVNLRKPTFAYSERAWSVIHDEKGWVRDEEKRTILTVTIHTRDQIADVAEWLQRAADFDWCADGATEDVNIYGLSSAEANLASPMGNLPAWEDIRPLDPVERAKVATLVSAARGVSLGMGCSLEEAWGMVAGARRQPDWRLYPADAS
jgi:hypothetical protein